jgi:outer membrane murein-binding lipoprotein Lpp
MITPSTKLQSAAILCGTLLYAAGCGSPSAANNELRKQNQDLQAQIKRLTTEQDGALRIIQGLRDSKGTIQTLPTTRLARLFTTHGIQFGRLTGGADIDPNKPGDDGLAVYVFPVDQMGQKLKAAGTFDVEAFDLAQLGQNQVGHWHLDLDQAKAGWNSTLLEYTYAFILPWQTTPHHPEITIKVTFVDELTQTPFVAQEVVQIALPPSQSPTHP